MIEKLERLVEAATRYFESRTEVSQLRKEVVPQEAVPQEAVPQEAPKKRGRKSSVAEKAAQLETVKEEHIPEISEAQSEKEAWEAADAYVKKYGVEKARAILGQFKVQRIADLEHDQRLLFIAALKKDGVTVEPQGVGLYD